MKLSYENFQRRHFQQVEILYRGIGYRESAKTLCKAGFQAEISNSEAFSNQQDVYVKLAEAIRCCILES